MVDSRKFMLALASVRDAPATAKAPSNAPRRSSVMPSVQDDDLALLIRRRASVGYSAPQSRGVVSADASNLISFRETTASSIRYECSADGVFFQREVPAARSYSASASNATTPGRTPDQGQLVPAYTAFEAPVDEQPSSRRLTPQNTNPPSTRSVSTRGGVVETSPALPPGIFPDYNVDSVSSLWPATQHNWRGIFDAAQRELKEMWDGEDVNWFLDGTADSGNVSMLFGAPPQDFSSRNTTTHSPSKSAKQLSHASGAGYVRDAAIPLPHQGGCQSQGRREGAATRARRGRTGQVREPVRRTALPRV
jgi:hypothetical protein